MHHRPLTTSLLTLIATTIIASDAYAQWAYTNLHPDAFQGSIGISEALACDGAEVVGWIYGDGLPSEPSPAGGTRGSVWGNNATPMKTFPVAYPAFSRLKGVSNGQYVGVQRTPTHWFDWYENGVLWNQAGQPSQLTPSSCENAVTSGICGNQQVGWVCGTWACLWYSTPESRVDLHVPGWSSSNAVGVWDGQQAGGVGRPTDPPDYSVQHAGVWHGSRESWLDLHPTHLPGVQSTMAQATSREQQAGYWFRPNLTMPLPCAWSATPESWVDLTPPNSTEGVAFGVAGGWQVGYVVINGQWLASLWRGSMQSWVNLQQFLPSDSVWSIANAVWTDGRILRVVGTRYLQPGLGDGRAFLLTRTLPCAADLDNDGSLISGGSPDNNVDINDLLFFLAAFEAGAPGADLDNNGDPAATIPDNAVDINDLLFFLARFEAGC